MSPLRVAVLMSAALGLTACSLGAPVPQATTYLIEPPPPAPASSRRPETLRVGRVRVAPAFADKPLVFRVDDVRYTADFYHAFITDPGDLLGARMAEWLDRSGPFKAVLQPGAAVPSSWVLDAAVTELYGDFRPGRPPAAVMTVQFQLVDLNGVTPEIRLQRTIGRRVMLRDASAAALVRGYGTALGGILAELARQMASDR